MHLVGHCTHVLELLYNEKPTIIQIIWTPKDKITKGAVYAIIRESKVLDILLDYDGDILRENVFGYRLEYLVMEDRGNPIVDFAKTGYDREHSPGAKLASSHVSQAFAYLASAYTAGVLHRDISSGNIAVDKLNNARIIDWGFINVFKA
ncbi:hypothetical protein BX070DRAFT_250216 [Coemansia spiralis]|nr:hypothetical protein BX070DRAFT_250216 [Coemansia spiralis]KAJ1989565.1 hypothetical protein EDC05_004599 [Coemansia umbellata]